MIISNIIFYSLYFYNIINVISIFLQIDYHDVSFFVINELISLIIVRCKEYMYVNIANNNIILLAKSHTQQTLLHVFACVNVTNVNYILCFESQSSSAYSASRPTPVFFFFFSLFTGDIVYDLIQHLPWDCFFL